MTNEQKFDTRRRVVETPSIKKLVRWNKQFAKMLTSTDDGTKLLGVDGKTVDILVRSRPSYFKFFDKLDMVDDSHGYCRLRRTDDSESDFRLDGPEGNDIFLTYNETDLVLGTNYRVVDTGYSSPSPFIRKLLFKADQTRSLDYNAFEIGTPASSNSSTLVPIVYYRISERRFQELGNSQGELECLIEKVRKERQRGQNER